MRRGQVTRAKGEGWGGRGEGLIDVKYDGHTTRMYNDGKAGCWWPILVSSSCIPLREGTLLWGGYQISEQRAPYTVCKHVFVFEGVCLCYA